MDIIKAIMTIDTEGHVGNDPVNKLIFGQTEYGEYGIEKIMSICDRYGVTALFFVDFAEIWEYGHDGIQQVISRIIDRGHDAGVHIHPDHMKDKGRPFLFQYSKEEQREMIWACTEKYVEIVGKRPLSFRAGKYGANRDTLDILSELGYRYDFSQYYGQKWSGIKPPVTINAPCKYKNLTEFPVTMHQSFSLFGIKRQDKIDIEQMQVKEFRYAIDEITKVEFPIVVTLFLHSFSLLDWVKNPSAPMPDHKKIARLEKALAYVTQHPAYRVISENDLDFCEVAEGSDTLKSEIKWHSNWIGIYYTYQKAKMVASRNKKAALLVLCVRIGVAVSLLGIIIAILWGIL